MKSAFQSKVLKASNFPPILYSVADSWQSCSSRPELIFRNKHNFLPITHGASSLVGHNMVLLHGLIKKTQKTPLQDFELAVKRAKSLE